MSVNTPVEEAALGLQRLQESTLLRQRRTVDGAQGPLLTVDGRQYLAFCSNDYLGLANHDALIAGARSGLDRFGVGAGDQHPGFDGTMIAMKLIRA